ncbi:hypothetical protein F3Y22_tig00110773pilonHSYRG00092 [Hibiscus syriacus]|uniref:Uncharacterized protein n=1 Tax=Hibiscus syriacus TaxID=106335 RepID=A0A6A2ZRZ3_HIBSY|nr:hypothetical protein F3Y22_tig00110773pilonHSYRG00092 [Hibiscus syriacus]
MWALRRLPKPLKESRINVRASYAASAQLRASSYLIEETATTFCSSQAISDKGLSLLRFTTQDASTYFSVRRCGLSSQAGAESSGEEDDFDGFSELETPANAETKGDHIVKDETEDGLDSDKELSVILKKLLQMNWNCLRLRRMFLIRSHLHGELTRNYSKLLSQLQVSIYKALIIG